MKIHSYGKKLMAAACAVVMLVSCMVFAPASAAINAKGTWDCEAPESSDWSNTGGNNNVVRDGASMTLETVTEDAAHSGTGVAVAKFTDNWSKANDTEQSVAACRLMIGEDNARLVKGRYYRVKFWYKIVNLPVDAELRFVIASRPWKGQSYNSVDHYYDAVALKTTDATGVWNQVDTVFYGDGNNGLHIFLKSTDDTQRIGTEVWLDDFEYYQVDHSDAVYLTLDANGGTVRDKYAYAIKGENTPITVTATHSDGYVFAGWYSSKESADNLVEADKVTVFPDNTTTTVYAGWKEPETPWYTVTFHANPGKLTGAATARYKEDTPITMSAPVRPGWEFTGWYTAAGNAGEKIAAVTGDVDAYAHWAKTGTVAQVDGLQTFEDASLSLDSFKYNSNYAMELTEEKENHTFAGEKSLKATITSGMNGQLTRPRFVLKNADGTDFVAEEGKDYTVSFWAKTDVAISKSLNFYLAAYDIDQIDAMIKAGGSGAYNAIPHTVQTLEKVSLPSGSIVDVVNKDWSAGGVISSQFEKATVQEAALGTGWTKFVVRIPAFVAHKVQNSEATKSYLALGITDTNAVGGTNYTSRNIYLDDIQIVETDTLDASVSHNYEGKTVGKSDGSTTSATGMAGTGNGRRVCDEVMNHTFGYGGVGKTAKLELATKDVGNPSNNYTALYKADGNLYQVTTGSSYLVSAWLYSATDADVDVYLRAASDVNNWISGGLSDLMTKTPTTVSLKAHTWTQVRLQGTVPEVKDGSCKYMALGVTNSKEYKTEVVYVDDTSVVCTDNALGKVSGNVGVYKNGDDTCYTENGTKYGALRLLGGYTIADGDATKAVIGGNTYTVKARGILLGKDEQTTLTVDGECYYKSEKTTNLDGYWQKEGNVLKYSLLVSKISADQITTNVHYRPYIIVTDGTAEYTLYGETVLNLCWQKAASDLGVDTSWTTK